MKKEHPPISPKSNIADSIQATSSNDSALSSFFLVSKDSNSGESFPFVPPKSPSSQYLPELCNNAYDGGKSESIDPPNPISIPVRRSYVHDWNDRRSSAFSGPSNSSGPSSFESFTVRNGRARRRSADPPRPPRKGMEWVWFPEGYWAERELHDTKNKYESSPKKWFTRSPARNSTSTQVTSKKETTSKSTPPITEPQIPQIQIVSNKSDSSLSGQISSKDSVSEKRLNRFKTGLAYMSPTYPHYVSPNGQPEGLYCKAKRALSRGISPKTQLSLDDTDSMMQQPLPSQTTMVLEGASNYLEQQEEQIKGKYPVVAPRSPKSPATSLRTFHFGLAPWHRRTSFESFLSVSSSVRRLLRGPTPAATPTSAAGTYIGNNGQTYAKVEISSEDHDSPTFLPSEATRIKTPPLSPTLAQKGEKAYFDAASSTHTSESQSGVGTELRRRNTSPGEESNQNNIKPVPTERKWWEIITDLDRPAEVKVKDAFGAPNIISSFDLNLPPEHLPSSPLCPKNPRHKSGGTGFCVYHGRKKSAGLRQKMAAAPSHQSSRKGYYEDLE